MAWVNTSPLVKTSRSKNFGRCRIRRTTPNSNSSQGSSTCRRLRSTPTTTTKADTYAALGVKELWLADELSKEIAVRTLEGDRYTPGTLFRKGETLISIILPEIRIDVSDVFED